MSSDERGMNESVQWAVLVPVLMLVLLGGVQVAITWHARFLAQHAAAAAAESEAAHGARPGDGRSAARDVLAVGGLDDVEVVVTPGPTTVTAVVSGRAPVLLPVGDARVSQSITLPRERVR